MNNFKRILGEKFAEELLYEAHCISPTPSVELVLALGIKKIHKENEELKKQIEELKNGK